VGTEWTVAGGLLLAAAGVLAVGAELFAEHAASAGRQLGVSGLAVGLLLAGAEPEELVTAVLAAVRDQPGIAAGDAIGANVTLLTLVTGGLALIAPVELGSRGLRYVMAASVATVAAWGVCVNGSVTPVEGAGLLVLYGLLVGGVWWFERDVPAIGELSELREDDDEHQRRSPAVGLLLALAGVAAMGAGGWLAVAGAERVIDLTGFAGSVVGLTAVALATTAEFVALIPAAVRRGIPELAAAGIVGSVLYNATVTLGAAALIGTLTDTGVASAAAAAAILTAVIAVLTRLRGRIGRPTAGLLLGGYLVYVALVWR
jgi:cation:H+ antiporter